jgi:hypothetical protein
METATPSTTCPKCGAPCAEGAIECVRCGVILARVRVVAPIEAEVLPAEPIAAEGLWTRLAGHWLAREERANGVDVAGAALTTLVLAALGWHSLVFDRLDQSYPTFALALVGRADFVFHEAGHIVFGVLGEVPGVLGGTLGQLTFPLVFLYVFLGRQQSALGAAAAVWWLGVNLADVAQYAFDAFSQALVLNGGISGEEAPGYHDWHNLLGRWGLLMRCHQLGWTLRIAGGVLVVVGVAGAAFVTLRRWRLARAGHGSAPG